MLKVPPHNLEAEQSIIGIMLVNADTILSVKSYLHPDDFYLESHALISAALFDAPRGQADLVSIVSDLKSRGQLGQVGGQDAIISIMESVQTTASWKHWCELIKDCSNRRKIINACANASDWAYGLHNDLPEGLATLKESLQVDTDIGPDYADNKSFYRDRFDIILSEEKKNPGLFTGVPGLEDNLYFEEGYIHCLAARTNTGKTALGLKISDYIQYNYGPVAFYSMESTRERISNRIIARKTRIPLTRINYQNIFDNELDGLQVAMNELIESRLYLIDDTKFRAIETLLSHAENYTRNHDIKFIVIDYLQKLKSFQRFNSKHHEISYIVNEIKALAKNLNIPILFLSQLKRKDNNPRPTTEELKESGDIENDTDNILFLWSPQRGSDEIEYECEFYSGKAKDQQKVKTWLHFNGHFQEFSRGSKPEKKKEDGVSL
ncbi:MAG: DnaB-like helicase C-terminal domain-containing protein [Desulfobacterales bacterium]